MDAVLLCTKLRVYQCMQALKHSGSWAFIAINQRRIKFLLATLGMPSECEGGVQHVVRNRCFYSSSSDRMQLCHTTIGPTVALCKTRRGHAAGSSQNFPAAEFTLQQLEWMLTHSCGRWSTLLLPSVGECHVFVCLFVWQTSNVFLALLVATDSKYTVYTVKDLFGMTFTCIKVLAFFSKLFFPY